MARGGLLLIGLVVFIAGCPPQHGQAPASRREALDRVNTNLGKIRDPLQCSALASFRFRDSKGTDRRFIGHEARLIFQNPQSLLFDVRSLAGVIAQFGSNSERYWVWIDPEIRKLWWGHWDRVRQDTPHALPIPPDDLLDALMLRSLPATLEGGQLPVLRKLDHDHRLLFVRLGHDGQPSGLREIHLDSCEPYQPREIIDWLPDGEMAMHALLSNYRRVGSGGPYTPRRYVVYWPLSQAEMRLDILRATWRPDLPAEVFEFPVGWEGDIERVDAPLPENARSSSDGMGRP